MFYQVKSKFKHSIIYNYTPNKLSKLTGLHHKTTERYVKKLINDDFCELRNGHLLFKTKKRILPDKEYRKSKYSFETRPYTSFDGILKRIYTILILNNKEQQKFKIAANYGQYVGEMNPRTFKKALRQADIKDRGLASSNRPVISLSGVSRLLNVSRGTSFKIMRGLKKRKYLKMTSFVLSFKSPIPVKYYSGLGHCFRRGNYINIHLGREINRGYYRAT